MPFVNYIQRHVPTLKFIKHIYNYASTPPCKTAGISQVCCIYVQYIPWYQWDRNVVSCLIAGAKLNARTVVRGKYWRGVVHISGVEEFHYSHCSESVS